MARIQEGTVSYYQQTMDFMKKYEVEIELAGKLTISSISILAVDVFNLPFFKNLKKNITLLKSVTYVSLGMSSAYDLMKLEVKSVNEAARNFFSAILVPFTVIDATSFLGLEKWEFVHDFFKESPVLSHLKFAGITNLSLIGLLTTFALDSFAKRQKLLEERVGLKGDELKKHDIKIIQNNWSLLEKTAKVASSVFSFVVLVGSYSHPAISAVKITFLSVEMGIALKRYQNAYLVPETIPNVA